MIDSINKKNNIYKQFCKSQNITRNIALQKKIQTLQELVCYNTTLTQRKIFKKKKIEENKKDSKKVWEAINAVIITKIQKNHDK